MMNRVEIRPHRLVDLCGGQMGQMFDFVAAASGILNAQ